MRQEMLNSERLKAHFEDNPLDRDALRHDNKVSAKSVSKHLAHIPSYLLDSTTLPKRARRRCVHMNLFVFDDLRVHRGKGGGKGKGKGKGGKGKARKNDPLKTFKI